YYSLTLRHSMRSTLFPYTTLFRSRILALIGLTVIVTTTFLLSSLTMEDSYFYLMTIYTVRMFGMSLVMMPVMTNGLNEIPMEANPHGTAINNTLQQVSGAIGTAFLLTIMTTKSKSASLELADKIASGKVMPDASLEHLAMLEGINHAFFISTILAFVSLVLALFIKKTIPYENNIKGSM